MTDGEPAETLSSLQQKIRLNEGTLQRMEIRRLMRRHPLVGPKYKYKPWEKVREDEKIAELSLETCTLRCRFYELLREHAGEIRWSISRHPSLSCHWPSRSVQ